MSAALRGTVNPAANFVRATALASLISASGDAFWPLMAGAMLDSGLTPDVMRNLNQPWFADDMDAVLRKEAEIRQWAPA